MRILFVTAGFLPDSIGGVELHLLGLARELRQDHVLMVFTRCADSDRPEYDLDRCEVEGLPVTRVNHRFSDCTSFEGIYRNPRIRERFLEELDRFRPDLVHVHHLTCLSTDLIDVAQAYGARVVMTLHDFWMGCPRGQRMTPDLELCETIDIERCITCLPRLWGGWFGRGRDGASAPEEQVRQQDLQQMRSYHAWMRALLARVDRLVTPSAASRDLFIRYGIAGERIQVVENGLDQAPLQGLRRTRSERFRFGYIGSVLPTKGVHLIIEALARLGRPDLCLEIHGEISPWHEITDYGDRLREIARPISEQVAFHGRYEPEALPGILASIDALVVPSLWYEAFCLTLREGFLAGLPVLVSNLGAMAEGVQDGVTGLLFESGNVADLAAKLTLLADNAELRERLIAAPKRVRTMRENAFDLQAIYAAVVAG